MIANNLLHGNWLGQWTPDILSKPPAYSLFLMFAHYIPVDPTLILHFIYLLIVLLLVRTLFDFRITTRISISALRRILFLFFAFNPALFANDFSRIYRTSFSTLTSFLFFVLILKLVHFLKSLYFEGDQKSWKLARFRGYSPLAISLGATYALMVLTRTEAYWVLICTIPLVSGIWITATRNNGYSWKSFDRYRSGKVLAKIIVVGVLSFLIPIGLVSEINRSTYGVSEIENFYTGNFARAINLWAGVENGKSNFSFISVSKGQREAVYSISPSALSLKPILDGPPNTGWKRFNCSSTKICDESGAWFPWELRSAAVGSRAIVNEVQFQEFFGGLADEILAACNSKKLICGRKGLGPGAKSLDSYPIQQLLDTSIKALASLFTVDQAINVSHPDNGQDPTQLEVWRSTVNSRYLIVPDEFSNWQGMASSITFLRTIYQGILPILFLIAVFSIFVPRKREGRILNWYALTILGSMVVFSGGLAIFEASLGFKAKYSLYALPMQPLLLLFIATAITNLASSYEDTSNQDIKR
jgi:hypothetical protein